ncbi:MAG: phosphoglucosamine mutase, partial [Clostridia bacterium]|nr:phosphoglucosamine mutase [Clostridia bacterium]
MAIKFGTDGIRGIAYKDLTLDIAYRVGNALGRMAEGCRIAIGRDTRVSGEDLSKALTSGLIAAGGSALDCALMPTAGVSYITKKYGCDFGVVISASHNPPEYNGIKIFDSQGFKASDAVEERIEELIKESPIERTVVGEVKDFSEAQKEYSQFLIDKGVELSGMKILLDCSNGASVRIAPAVFKALGADVTAANINEDGNLINADCGAVNADLLAQRAKDFDVTFAFDGDSDRLIALDENGEIVDGDRNLLIIGKYLKDNGKLTSNIVVGTSMTNLGIEKAVADLGICFERVDVGDKYVMRKLVEKGGILGGEGSGHTIMLNESATGDGIQTAVILAKIMKRSGKKLSDLAYAEIYPQIIHSVTVKDKEKVLSDKELNRAFEEMKSKLDGVGRIILRPSGTEQKIRVMVESPSAEMNSDYVKKLTKLIEY